MARTFVQQSQISGSLSFDDTLAAGSALAGKQTLVEDLNALRSQLNKIIGGERWYAELSGSQNLADIHAAMVVSGDEATFQGNITGSAGLDLQGAAHLESTLLVDGAATFGSDAHVMGNGDVDGTLTVGGVADFAADVFAGAHLGVSGTLDVAQAASLGSTLSVDGVADFAADVYAAAALGVSGTLDVAQAASLGSTLSVDGVADFAADVFMAAKLGVSGTLAVAQKADFADIVDVAGTLSASAIKIDGDVIGHLYLVGSEGEIQDSAALRYEGATLFVTGAMEVSNGISVLAGGMTVAGDRLEVTGSFGLLGNAALDGDLDVTGATTLGSTLSVDGVADFAADVYMAAALGVSGSLTVAQAATLSNGLTVNGAAADFNADVTANKISIDGDVAKHLYIVDSDGSIKDEDALWFDGSKLYVTGSLETSSDARVGGDLTVAGNDILDSADEIVLSFKSINSVADSVEVAHNMEVKGDMFYAVSGSFSGDLTVVGDLTIQGSMTYIDTENLKVKDTLIHLNVAGNSNLSPRGIVLHGDQAYDDLAFGAKPASGDFVFAKEVSDADVDAGNSDVFAAAKLASAWLGEAKLGGIEGSLSGSLAASVGGIELSSAASKEIAVTAATDLLLSANGETAISFIESGEYALFNAQFPGSSLVAAIVAAGGNFKQDSFKPGIKTAGVDSIDYSSVGTLRTTAYASTAAKKLAMDVYLNGVRLAYSDDYAIDGSGVLTLTMDTTVDDVLTVVIHNSLT